MVDNIDLEEILALNPHIDKETLKEAIELMIKMQQSGVKEYNYNLISPFARRRATIDKDIEKDPRTVHVRRHSRI